MLNRYGRPIARRVIHLEPDAVVVAAMKRSKLPDLGTETISEPFEVLCRALRDEAQLHSLGRLAARSLLVGMLTTRAKAIQLVTTHPEIESTDLAPPIVVMGMPGSGARFLQRLLAADATLRHLPSWEAKAPMPSRTPAIRELDPREAADDSWLLGSGFASMLFEWMWHVPAFAEWYDEADLSEGYRWLRRMLAILHWYRPGDRWLLRSPQHLERLVDLTPTFPGAVLVQVHRDPVKVVTSTAAMVTSVRRLATASIIPSQIGRYWQWRTHRMLDRNLRQRERRDAPPILDVHFEHLMADPMAVVGSIYERAGRELTDKARRAMEHHVAEQRERHLDVHTVEPEQFGIDAQAVHRDHEEYTARFDVCVE